MRAQLITRRLNPWVRGALLTPLVLLAACGGGGGDPASNCFTTSDGDCLTNAELGERAWELTEVAKDRNHTLINTTWRSKNPGFANALKWTAEAVNAHQAAAHLALAHGDGALNEEVTIGFIDTGIHEDHETFDYVSVTEEFLLGAVDEDPGEWSHGTGVASVAAGNFVDLPSGSPDWNINVKMFVIPLGSGGGPYTPIMPKGLSAADFRDAELFKYVLSQDLDILNLSFGYSGGIENYSEQVLRNNYSKTIAALAQAGRQEKTILVWAAGNAGKRANATPSSPEIDAGLVARAEELQGHSIAVVSTREDGTISDFSNRCGIAADFCIAAPGEQVLAANAVDTHGDPYDLFDGTSFAAPMVSGGLITMKKLFRDQLSNEQLVSRLFETAKDDGIYANPSIYGHGLMDLGAATNPWGIPAFMGTLGATGTRASITSTSLTLGAPLGDGLTHTLASQEIAAFDALGAPFWFQASQFTVPSSGTSIATRLSSFLNPTHPGQIPDSWQFSFQQNASAMETGHLALMDGASRFSIDGPQGLAANSSMTQETCKG